MSEIKPADTSDMTRRAFLGAGAAAAVTAVSGSAGAQQPAMAQQAPREKGPRVWLDMDQTELDAAYDQGVYASRFPRPLAIPTGSWDAQYLNR